MSTALATQSCPFCGWSNSRTITGKVRNTPYGLRHCRECDLEYLSPAPSWEDIQRIYDASYYKSWGMAEGETTEVAEMKKATFELRIREIRKYARTGRILDVGTASGFFLEVAESAGFDPYGVELSAYSASLARRKFGTDRIWLGTLETAPFEPEYFDVVAMSDLIEHVTDPVRTLERARDLLAPSGVLMMMTPNTASFTRRVMGSAWTHYKLEHLTYWNPRTVRKAAAQTGFEVLSIHPAWKIMTLGYLDSQFQTYPNPVLTPLVRHLAQVFAPLRDQHFRIAMGEMVALLRREDE